VAQSTLSSMTSTVPHKFEPPAVGLVEAAITERVDPKKGLPLEIHHAFAEAKNIEWRAIAKSDSLEKEVKENREELEKAHKELEATRQELEATRQELEDTRRQMQELMLSLRA
jgi:molecular chaperone GrpE (heat shock protein)